MSGGFLPERSRELGNQVPWNESEFVTACRQKRKRPGGEARPRSPQEPNPRYVAPVSRKIGHGPIATNYDESFYLETLWHVTFVAAFVDFSAQRRLI